MTSNGADIPLVSPLAKPSTFLRGNLLPAFAVAIGGTTDGPKPPPSMGEFIAALFRDLIRKNEILIIL